MGLAMKFKNPGAFVDKIARDGHQFGHVTETLRDSLLAGADNVVYGVHGLYDNSHEYPCVARRYIGDDGSGMSRDVLSGPYSSFSDSATEMDIEVTLDPAAGEVAVSLVPVSPTDNFHSRNGIGGRGTLVRWNPFGVVTITFHQGKPMMVWSYRANDGEYHMRQWKDEYGVKRSVVAPYTELEDYTRAELLVDPQFSRMMLVRSGFCSTDTEADGYIQMMEDTDTIPNALANLEWDGDVVPRWITDRYGDDGLAYRADGELAHGTVKYLLGEKPSHHTALTGDPSFINEKDYKRYNGVGNHFFLDLTPWNVKIQTLVSKQRKGTRRMFHLAGEEGTFRLESGIWDDTTKPTGRSQDGALAARVKYRAATAVADDADDDLDDEAVSAEDPVEHRTVLDLGEYGLALILVRKKQHGKDGKEKTYSSPNFWSTTRAGVVGVVYGNEVHGLRASEIDTSDYMFRNMGIPAGRAFKNRVSVFLFPPRASDTTPGVYQDIARDGLKWSTLGDLPITEINNAIRVAIPEQDPALDALFNSAIDTSAPEVDAKKAQALWLKAKTLVEKGTKFLKGDEDEAGISDKGGSGSGSDAGSQGSPGPSPRDPCPECGQKIHKPDCSRKKASTGGGGGGRSGNRQRTDLNNTGIRSRKSRAKRQGEESGTSTVEVEDETPPNPPRVSFEPMIPDEDQPEYPAVYTPPRGDFLPETGEITVNENHVTVRRLYGVAASADRDEAETKRLVKDWIRDRLIETVYGTLTLKDQVLAPGASAKDINGLAEDLGKPEVWMTTMAGMLMADDSLKGYIVQHAPVKRGKPRARRAAPQVAAAPAVVEPMGPVASVVAEKLQAFAAK